MAHMSGELAPNPTPSQARADYHQQLVLPITLFHVSPITGDLRT
jgi:hypothetical protein